MDPDTGEVSQAQIFVATLGCSNYTYVEATPDKSLVELGVKFVTTRILTCIRTRQFFSIEELNQAIAPLLKQLNEIPFQKKQGTRRGQFEELDRPAMRPLPDTWYEFRQWKKLVVNVDYHIQADFAYYSVPHRLRRKKLDVCIGETLVKCYYKNELVATHQRLRTKGCFSTNRNHMPEKHLRYRDREHLLARARSVGPETERLTEAVLDRRSHQEQNFRAVLGILGLKDRYGPERLESACRLAGLLGPRAFNYPSIASILQKGRDLLRETAPDPPTILHENLRGGVSVRESHVQQVNFFVQFCVRNFSGIVQRLRMFDYMANPVRRLIGF
ncbi:MAG: hypothetical protein OXD43_14600 [Bacteroidetes bacterium]|nr:hypothetical protein [Bacteroidota bacterium]